ncbi:MAG: AAA family ATPase [Solirubrobacterales bacterium]
MASRGKSEFHLWPLAQVDVEGLFGRKKAFSLELDTRLTVLTGENGSGKSTLLKAIHLFGLEEWSDLFVQPLGGLNLSFTDGPELAVTWLEDALTVSNGSDEWSFDAESALQFGPGMLRDFKRSREGGHERPLRVAGRWRPDAFYSPSGLEELERLMAPDWLSDLTERFQTKLISARRLEHRLRPDADAEGEEAHVPAVEEFAIRLRETMKNQLSAYAADSRRQEKILPTKIVEAMQQQGPVEDPEALADEVTNLRSEVLKLADSLARVGLFEEEDPDHLGEYPRDNTPILLAVREVYRVTKGRLCAAPG